MEIQILKQEIKDVVKRDSLLQGLLADFNGIGTWALGQWRLKNNPMLTTVDNLKIIRDYITSSKKKGLQTLHDLLTDPLYELTEPVEVDENGNIIGANERGEIIKDNTLTDSHV